MSVHCIWLGMKNCTFLWITSSGEGFLRFILKIHSYLVSGIIAYFSESRLLLCGHVQLRYLSILFNVFFDSSTNFDHRVNAYLPTYVLLYRSCRASYGQFNATSFVSTSVINKNHISVVSQLVLFIVDDLLKINHYWLLGENKKSF